MKNADVRLESRLKRQELWYFGVEVCMCTTQGGILGTERCHRRIVL